MKRIGYVALVLALAATAATFAALYLAKNDARQEYFLHSHDGQWVLSGDKRLFEVTERAFDAVGLFGFREGIGKWAPVGGKAKALFRANVVAGSLSAGIGEDEYVIGVVAGETATAYPLRVVAFHQVVNDDSQEPTVVYFGNHSHTACAFSAGRKNEETWLASTGLLYKNVDLLFDSRTESLFLPAAGMFVSGERLGERLTVLPSAVVRFDEWMKMYPQSRVMTLNTGLKAFKYPRREILEEGVGFKVPLKTEFRPKYDNAEAVIATSDGWYTTGVVFASAKRANKREVAIEAGGKRYTAHFSEDYKACRLTDASGALAPSIRTTYRPYVAIMREAVIAEAE